MKNIGLAILLTVVLATGFLIIRITYSQRLPKNTISYTLDNKKYNLLTAKNPSEWEKGLMNYRKLPESIDGMLFIFPEKNYQTFWNKNTYLDLNVYWIDNDKVIGKDFLPSIEKNKNIVIINSPEKVDKVIEVVASSK